MMRSEVYLLTGVALLMALLVWLIIDDQSTNRARIRACTAACSPYVVEESRPRCICNPALVVVPEEDLEP